MFPFWGHKLLAFEKHLTGALHTKQLLWEAAMHTEGTVLVFAWWCAWETNCPCCSGCWRCHGMAWSGGCLWVGGWQAGRAQRLGTLSFSWKVGWETGAGQRAQAPSRGLGTPSASPVSTKENHIAVAKPRPRAGRRRLYQGYSDETKIAPLENVYKLNRVKINLL